MNHPEPTPSPAQAITAYLERHQMSQRAFAELLSVNPSAVSQWACGRTRMATEIAKLAEEKTGGELPRHILRPDVYDPPASAA